MLLLGLGVISGLHSQCPSVGLLVARHFDFSIIAEELNDSFNGALSQESTVATDFI